MDAFWHDVRLGWTALRRKPGLVAVAALTLGLGIGVSTTLYAVFLPQMYDMPPVPEPDRLTLILKTNPALGIERGRPSLAEFAEWRDSSRGFEEFAAILEGEATLTLEAGARRVDAHRVSVNFFDTIGVRPALGRVFRPDEATLAGERAVIISHALWRGTFRQDPGILGRTVVVDDQACTIVGVMPQGFWFNFRGVDIWTPLEAGLDAAETHVLVTARRKPETSWAQAQVEVDTITGRAFSRDVAAGWRTHLATMPEEAVKRVRVAAVVFLPALAVLLIACVNVANLLLAHGAGRAHEMAIRAAVGASRWRLVRQLFVESVWLAAGGGCVGLVLTYWGIEGMRRVAGQSDLNYALRIVITPSVLAVALLMTVLTPLVFGLVPALRASSPDVGEILKGGVAGERLMRGYRLRDLLVPLQLALAVVLLVTAGMFVRFMWELEHLPPGFDDRRLYVADIMARSASGADRSDAPPADLAALLIEQIRAVPGVGAAVVASGVPAPGGGRGSRTVRLDEATAVAGLQAVIPLAVTPGFLATLGIPLPRGRDFSVQDGPGGTPVAIVSAHLARRWWPDRDPIGRTFTLEGGAAPSGPLTVVGVAGDVMTSERLQSPYIYLPLRQAPPRRLAAVVRLAGGDQLDVAALTQAVARVPPLRLDQVWSVRERLAAFGGSGLMLGLFGGFAGLALLLAAVGVYTVVSQAVSARLREIGIRRALGAGGGEILRAIFGPTLALCGVGSVLGAAGTLAVTWFTWSLLLDVSATAPGVWLVILGVLTFAGVAALVAPARRVLRVDPAVVLRQN